jgi:hypothetical protein
MTFIVTVYAHSVSHQRIECDDFTLAISNNLCIGVSVKKQVHHQGLPEDKGCHLRIRLIMYQAIQRMLDCLFLAAGVGVLINRQVSNRLGENPDASVDGSHLHGISFIYSFTGITATKQEAVSAAVGAVLPKFKQKKSTCNLQMLDLNYGDFPLKMERFKGNIKSLIVLFHSKIASIFS